MAENTDSKRRQVIDASAILARLLPDEQSDQTINQTFLDYKEGKLDLYAPGLLRYEIGNALRSLVLSSRITHTDADSLYLSFLSLEIHFSDDRFTEILPLAVSSKISFYDASYLFLARELNLKLLTLDKKLKKLAD